MRLKLTKEGAKYANELSQKRDLEMSEEDWPDMNMLAWASHGHRTGYPLDPDKLKLPENLAAVRRLFEAGFLEIVEEGERE